MPTKSDISSKDEEYMALDAMYGLSPLSKAEKDRRWRAYRLLDVEKLYMSNDASRGMTTLKGDLQSGKVRASVAVCWLATIYGMDMGELIAQVRAYEENDDVGLLDRSYVRVLRALGSTAHVLNTVGGSITHMQAARTWTGYNDSAAELRQAANAVADELNARAAMLEQQRQQRFGQWDSYFIRASETFETESVRSGNAYGWREYTAQGMSQVEAKKVFHEECVRSRRTALAVMESNLGGIQNVADTPPVELDCPAVGSLVNVRDGTLNKDTPLYFALPAASVYGNRDGEDTPVADRKRPASPGERDVDVSPARKGSTPDIKRMRLSFGEERT